MNRFFISIRCIILAFTGILSSCNDREQEYLLKESNIRLEQQNISVSNRNKSLREIFFGLKNKYYTINQTAYLEKDAKKLFSNSDNFFWEITSMKTSPHQPNRHLLFKSYIALQNFYQHFKRMVADNSSNNLPDININGFMNLNEKQFDQKYFGSNEVKNTSARLLLLETDALLNEAAFLESVLIELTPTVSCGASQLRAIATSSNYLYKKGDKLRITSLLVQYARYIQTYAVINGQKIDPKDGVFEYSRIITESPGLYKVPVEIVYLNANNREEIYSAEVKFQVE